MLAMPTAAPADRNGQTAPPVESIREALPGLGLFSGFLLALAWPMLRWWHWEYTRPESYYGFAFFVPPLVALMLWHRRRELAAVPKRPAPAALLLATPALLLLTLAVKTEMQAVMSWAFLLSVLGGVWFVLGTRFVRVASFPLLFLWLMAPLPGPVLNDLTLQVQSLSTEGATMLLTGIGLHPVRFGNMVHLDNYILNVDVPCSGFKLLLTLFTFNSAFAFLTDSTPVRRWGLFLIGVPLSVFVNSVRIALIGVVGECLGTSAAVVFHDWSGMLSLVLCMVLLFGTAKVLGCRTFAGQRIF
ncbi:MAG: exosortase/archaeosortase family protein [Capsulimonadales bacterium]|nr:exosortase/archaeosortase family protein [Capsulimonadales bacterium]